jgi:hypothetical protein
MDKVQKSSNGMHIKLQNRTLDDVLTQRYCLKGTIMNNSIIESLRDVGISDDILDKARKLTIELYKYSEGGSRICIFATCVFVLCRGNITYNQIKEYTGVCEPTIRKWHKKLIEYNSNKSNLKKSSLKKR